jgi:hypothetical protein
MKSCFTTVKIAMFEKLAMGLLVIPLVSFSGEKASAFSVTGAKTNTAKVEYEIGKNKYYSKLNPSSIKSLIKTTLFWRNFS